MKMKSFALALGLLLLLAGTALASAPAADAQGAAAGAPTSLTPPPSTVPAPLLCAVVSDTPEQDPGPSYIIVHCSGNCGATRAAWSCLNENCCTDCTSNPLSPRFGCLSAAGVCR